MMKLEIDLCVPDRKQSGSVLLFQQFLLLHSVPQLYHRTARGMSSLKTSSWFKRCLSVLKTLVLFLLGHSHVRKKYQALHVYNFNACVPEHGSLGMRLGLVPIQASGWLYT